MKRLQKERTPPPHPHTQKKKWSKEIREQTSLIASASVSNSLKNLDCRPAAKKQFKQISGVIFSHMEESFIKRKAHFVQMHCTNISNRQRRWRSSPMKLLMNMMVVSRWCVCVYICWTPSSIKDLTVSTSCMHEIKAAAKWVKKTHLPDKLIRWEMLKRGREGWICWEEWDDPCWAGNFVQFSNYNLFFSCMENRPNDASFLIIRSIKLT